MRLKKLKVHGFKSFADEVTLHFDVDLIALVGPNGCGKSNIVDAFRWVIGEQSAKSMRADKMNDVIFAGSEKRKPQNYAEVSLHLSNVSHPLIAFDEVTITRRLYRSGESEYLINKEPCRLKDIQSLFFGSGVGKNAISIFEQGKLDQIIYLTPIERRALFDETAGINRFLQRKKEVQRRLEEVTVNYGRLKDMHTEVEKRQKQLKKQAEEAKHYQANKERLELLEKQLILCRFQKLEEMIASLHAEKDPLSIESKEAKENFAALERSEEEVRKKVFEKEREVKQAEEQVYSTQSHYKIKIAEEKREKERKVEISERQKKLKKETEEAQKEKEALAKALTGVAAELKKLESEKQEAEKNLEAAAKNHSQVYEQLKKLQNEEKEFQKQQFALLAEENQIERKLQEKTLRKESITTELKKLKHTISERKETIDQIENQISEKKKEIDAIAQGLDASKADLDRCLNQLKAQQEEIKQLEIEKGPCVKKFQELVAKENALKELMEDFEGLNQGSKQLLLESKNPKSLLFGLLRPLYEVFAPKKKNLRLTAQVLKNYAATLVVSSKEDAKAVLEFAEKKKISDFSLIVRDSVEQLEFDLSSVGDIDALLKKMGKAGKEIALDERYVIDHNGVLFIVGDSAETSTFTRQSQLDELKNEIALLQIQLMKLEKNEKASAQKKEQLEKEKIALDALWRKKEMALMQQQFTLQQYTLEIKKLQQEGVNKEKEIKNLESLVQNIESDIEKFAEELSGFREKKKALGSNFKESEKALKEGMKAETSSFAERRECESKLNSVLEKYRLQESESKILRAKEQMKQGESLKVAKELETLSQESEKNEARLLALTNEVSSCNEDVEKALSASENIKREALAIHMQLEGLQKGMTRERKRCADLDAKEHRLDISIAEMTSKTESCTQELSTRFQMTMEDALQTTEKLDIKLEEGEKLVQRLRLDIEKSQTVNLGSIEELQVEQRRFTDLDKQLGDLQETKEDLEKLTKSIEQESRKLFKETFEQVRSNFQKNFELLFNGGKADLKFTESQDVLEAGIEIIAQPPGKQMRSISLLSGGEKCMTALALLFSIFQYKPAPFCILDEVDAPLDDANVGRFTKMLKEFVGNTQFIIVTHNKKTMAIADILFGVSMEEKGVSKLLTIEFEKKHVTASV